MLESYQTILMNGSHSFLTNLTNEQISPTLVAAMRLVS